MLNELDNKQNKRFMYWLIAGLFLLAASITVSSLLDMKRLSAGEVINIAFDWLGMATVLIILNSSNHGRKTKSSYSFMRLTLTTFFILFFEVGTWAVDKIACLRFLNYFCNIGANSMMLVNILFYMAFMMDSLDIKDQKKSMLYCSSKWIICLGIAAEIINIPFGYFYTVDASGVYHGNDIGSMIGFIPFIYVIGCSCFLVLKQNITSHKKLNFLSYVIVPLIISIWYTITALPPTLYLSPFIALLIIYGNIYIRQGEEMERSLLENARKDAQLAWQRNQLTRSQIKPHFIFNCLGSIEQLCRIDAEEARIAMHRFAKYLRVNMDAMSEQALIPFTMELEHIRNYVWLEQMRFEDDLEYEEEIETTNFSLPPLSIQPIVENAIKHGMMGKEDGVLKVTMNVHETDGFYEIKIEDNGNGFDVNQKIEDGRSHIGISNVRESLEKTVNGQMMISSSIGHGTMVVILIPKESRDNAL